MIADAAGIEDAAMAWLIRLQDPEFDRWDDWERWLTANPAHAETYWRLADADADLVDPAAPTAAIIPLRRPRPARRSRGMGGSRRAWPAVGLAAALVLACGLAWATWSTNRGRVIETAPGEARSLTLADGSRVHLSGGSRLALARDPRRVTLDAGRALFEVAHDDADLFTVQVGDARVTDLGTVFDVTRLATGERVSVAEGAVRYEADGRSETLQAGEGLVVLNGVIARRVVDAERVGGWRDGRLAYRDETLGVIAQDLALELGRPVALDPDIASRRFTGSLVTTGSEAETRERLAGLLGVAVDGDSEGWRLRAPAGP